MNVVMRELTQNLRDIRTNWAGSAGWLLLAVVCVLVMAGRSILGRWSSGEVLDGRTDVSGALISQTVRSVFFGGAVAIPWILFLRIRRPFRALPIMWCLFSTAGFIADADLPYSSATSFWIKIAAVGFLAGIVTLLRNPVRRYLAGSEDLEKTKFDRIKDSRAP